MRFKYSFLYLGKANTCAFMMAELSPEKKKQHKRRKEVKDRAGQQRHGQKTTDRKSTLKGTRCLNSGEWEIQCGLTLTVMKKKTVLRLFAVTWLSHSFVPQQTICS